VRWSLEQAESPGDAVTWALSSRRPKQAMAIEQRVQGGWHPFGNSPPVRHDPVVTAAYEECGINFSRDDIKAYAAQTERHWAS
jgi:hypothetical protein